MHAVEERASARSRERAEAPGFLERRDERGLFPELAPDPTIVRKIKRIDRRWRVEWHRGLGRFVLFHDHERFGRAQVPTVVVQTPDKKFLPLDDRVVRQVEFGAWAERNFRDPCEYDEFLERLAEAREEAIEQHNAEQRKLWLRKHAKQIYQSICDGTFYDETPEPPSPIYFT